ncbi:MAG: hypothetical protein ABT22_10045 [Thiobacillus sp. SCN 64-317]|nr:BON domain-containing protein [Thiobacillus sp.]ODV11147.1 MAG: hypothetical protein ABT22_10045 [Thiobacillus sp. SCN 64-317]
MQNGHSIIKAIRAGLEREPRINLHRWPIHLEMSDDGVLIMQGDVESLSARKIACGIAGAVPEVRGVVDRLQIATADPKGDGEILDVLGALLLDARDLKNCTLRVMKKGQPLVLQKIIDDDASGDILAAVEAGVVTLDGWVISLSHKRLAGVLAWWTPGCRDVVNALEVVPPEQDGDDEISDALSLVLEMDPLILHSGRIRIQTQDGTVTLQGLVRSQAEKERAEQDAWCLFAVDNVINRIAVD